MYKSQYCAPTSTKIAEGFREESRENLAFQYHLSLHLNKLLEETLARLFCTFICFNLHSKLRTKWEGGGFKKINTATTQLNTNERFCIDK